jgi:hypothetical protein
MSCENVFVSVKTTKKHFETAQNRIEMPGYAFDPVSIYKRSEREKPGIHRAL